MIKVLVVEDESMIAAQVAKYITREGRVINQLY